MQATMHLTSAGAQKAKLRMQRWTHHDFLQNLVGKDVFVEREGAIFVANLKAYDNYTLAFGKGDAIDAVVFKGTIRVIEAYLPEVHDPLFGADKGSDEGAH